MIQAYENANAKAIGNWGSKYGPSTRRFGRCPKRDLKCRFWRLPTLMNRKKAWAVSGPICSRLGLFKTAYAIEGKESRLDRGRDCSPD
jgi:hypothetical protein